MIFLPASFIAVSAEVFLVRNPSDPTYSQSVFGMNVAEFNQGSRETIAHYIEVTISLTLLTIYVVVTLQPHNSFHDRHTPFLRRAAWPALLLWKMMYKLRKKTERTMGEP